MGQSGGRADREVSALPPKLAEVVDMLAMFTDRNEKIQAIISIAESFRGTQNPKPYDESHRVPGCESEVYAWAESEDGRWHFEFAVENPQGLSAMAFGTILQNGLDGLTKDEIFEVPDELVYDIFGRELSMGKSMGLINMLQMCKRLSSA